MHRIYFLIASCLICSGCVYRSADIPYVSSVELEPQKVYILTNGEAHEWQSAMILAVDLEKAGFASSITSDLSDISENAYVIDEIEPWGLCFSEPMITVITLGLIPHIGCSEFGHAFMLYRKGNPNKAYVNAKYTVKVMIGWFTWPAAFSESYSFTSTTVDVKLRDQTPIRLLRRELKNAM